MLMSSFKPQTNVSPHLLTYLLHHYSVYGIPIHLLPIVLFLYRYKLSLKVMDDTASMETIAFSFVAEDLLEQTAMQASQNMKIDASDHAVALEKAIGKKRLFSIGMNPKYFSRFSINHVLKKSYKIHDDTSQVNV
ncbi:hypothetical protein BRADI_4g18361v3 [Brachypodium distachyon]|uniref:Uncharacterized protein n=1 Tax=Brachypodium distachyon TaxID=15368 RepID=A0A2K2CNM1_BRADI|nr:hypothetical protein BRADI_4g18361v3 [Brachypodium distachyon]